jgi:Leucine-rich repeat (LRR) protein
MYYQKVFVFILLITFTLNSFAQDELLSDRELSKTTIFKSMEEALKNPKNVYRLDLSRKDDSKEPLNTIPEEIATFLNLQELNLANNKLIVVPVELSQLSNLQVLDLSFNQIESFPAEMSKLKNLHSLILKFTRLKEFPACFLELSELKYIDLFANMIQEFPDEMVRLKKLEVMGIGKNGLSDVELNHLTEMLPGVVFE